MADEQPTLHQGPPAPPLEAYLRMLCEQAGVAVVGTDTDRRIRFWNRAATRMFEVAAEQMLNTGFASVVPEQDRAEAEQVFDRALAAGEIGEFEFCSRGVHGSRRQLAAVVAPVVADDGAVIGTSVCVRDITRRLVLQERLGQSRKMASLGAMAGAMAHYYNNILGGIITSVDFALASDHPVMQRRALEKTASALARAAELGDSLLTFAEGDFRTAHLADLTETLLEVVEQTQPELEGSGIELVVNITPIPTTAIPRVQFRAALNNVIHNAVESMPDGGTLTAELGPSEGGFSVRIIDTGCGVAEDRIDRVFEPFYSTKGEGAPGTGTARPGLGLAVAHGILQYIGGRISVTSHCGEGSEFELWLPTTPKLPPAAK